MELSKSFIKGNMVNEKIIVNQSHEKKTAEH